MSAEQPGPVTFTDSDALKVAERVNNLVYPPEDARSRVQLGFPRIFIGQPYLVRGQVYITEYLPGRDNELNPYDESDGSFWTYSRNMTEEELDLLFAHRTAQPEERMFYRYPIARGEVQDADYVKTPESPRLPYGGVVLSPNISVRGLMQATCQMSRTIRTDYRDSNSGKYKTIATAKQHLTKLIKDVTGDVRYPSYGRPIIPGNRYKTIPGARHPKLANS